MVRPQSWWVIRLDAVDLSSKDLSCSPANFSGIHSFPIECSAPCLLVKILQTLSSHGCQGTWGTDTSNLEIIFCELQQQRENKVKPSSISSYTLALRLIPTTPACEWPGLLVSATPPAYEPVSDQGFWIWEHHSPVNLSVAKHLSSEMFPGLTNSVCKGLNPSPPA